jgi:hypothetical protein
MGFKDFVRKRTGDLVLGGILVASLGVVALDACSRKNYDGLKSHIEAVDGKQGISISDALDFGKRAGINTTRIKTDYALGRFTDFNYPSRNIKRALSSYETQ